MVINIIALAILLITALIIGTLIFRKLPQLASIEVGQIPEERYAELKKQLATDRMIRKVRLWFTNLSFVTDLVDFVGKRIRGMFERLRVFERRLFLRKTNDVNTVIAGVRHMQERDPAEAERLLLEVIKTDHKNVAAYEGLVDIYLGRKEWQEATEALVFLVKLNPTKKVHYLFALTNAYRELGNTPKALSAADRLIKEAPTEPRFLDIFIELAILMSDKMRALDGLLKLKSVNPENAKIAEFEKRIGAMAQ